MEDVHLDADCLKMIDENWENSRQKNPQSIDATHLQSIQSIDHSLCSVFRLGNQEYDDKILDMSWGFGTEVQYIVLSLQSGVVLVIDPVKRIRRHGFSQKFITAVAFLEQHEVVLSGGLQNCICMWVRKPGGSLLAQQRVFHEHDQNINSLQFQSEGRFLSAAGDGLIKLWDLEATTCFQTFERHAYDAQSIEVE